jgi:hypothetical protein
VSAVSLRVMRLEVAHLPQQRTGDGQLNDDYGLKVLNRNVEICKHQHDTPPPDKRTKAVTHLREAVPMTDDEVIAEAQVDGFELIERMSAGH